jgi:hypothetical protein
MFRVSSQTQGYVFAPVIGLLEELGYVEGVDLIAASYDWRFAPSVLEKRVGYFSQLIRSIETLYHHCQNRGVVLLAHSMGNKVVSYFLEFAKKTKGQAWINQHINLWLAAGAPHCGAPQALRSTVFGEVWVGPFCDRLRGGGLENQRNHLC